MNVVIIAPAMREDRPMQEHMENVAERNRLRRNTGEP